MYKIYWAFPWFLFSRAFNSLLIVSFVSQNSLLIFRHLYFVCVCVPISLWRHSHQVTGLVFFSFLQSSSDPYHIHTFCIIFSFLSLFVSLPLFCLHDENICTWFAAGDGDATIVIIYNIIDMNVYIFFCDLLMESHMKHTFIQHFFSFRIFSHSKFFIPAKKANVFQYFTTIYLLYFHLLKY